jgi:hypothetical protein
MILRRIVCSHVRNHERPVLLASRTDELVCLLCGKDDHADSPDEFTAIGASHVTDRDRSVAEVLDLGLNEEAERTGVGSSWRRQRIMDEG